MHDGLNEISPWNRIEVLMKMPDTIKIAILFSRLRCHQMHRSHRIMSVCRSLCVRLSFQGNARFLSKRSIYFPHGSRVNREILGLCYVCYAIYLVLDMFEGNKKEQR